jgi:hypothetical protein
MKTVYETSSPVATIKVIRGTMSELGAGQVSCHPYYKWTTIVWAIEINDHIHFSTKTKKEAILAADWIASTNDDWEVGCVEMAWECNRELIL